MDFFLLSLCGLVCIHWYANCPLAIEILLVLVLLVLLLGRYEERMKIAEKYDSQRVEELRCSTSREAVLQRTEKEK